MHFMTSGQGWLFLLLYGLGMLAVTYFFGRWAGWKTKDGFLLAERKAGWWLMGPSIAASWIWAGALFVSVQMSYEKGLAGLFWFLAPNFVALAIFYYLGPKIREHLPKGYTLPQYIGYRLKSDKVRKLYLIPFLIGQLVAITFNVFAGGTLVATLTGIKPAYVMAALIAIVVTYALISGLEASVATDFFQMILIYGALFLLVPWALYKTGFGAVSAGFGGVTGGFMNIFRPDVALGFGIVTSIGLISQTINDQQYWQRVFASKLKDVGKAFIFGAFLFAFVPLALSMFGFMAAGNTLGVYLPEHVDLSMVGVLTVHHLLPSWALVFFAVALLSGLTSTVDSAMIATSSLYVTDIAKKSVAERQALMDDSMGIVNASERNLLDSVDHSHVTKSRWAALVMAGVGLLFAYILLSGFGVKQLFLFSISICAATMMPTIFSLYWDDLPANGVFWGVLISMVVGIPGFFWADSVNSDKWMALFSLSMLIISSGFCWLWPRAKTVEVQEEV